MDNKKKVVFVCTHNAGKSRLAESYLRQLAGDRYEVLSGGIEPSDSANPAAVDSARAAGLELTAGPGRKIDTEMTRDATVVTFGCVIEDLPRGVDVENWDLVDEAGKPLRDYDKIRDAITERVDELVERLDGNAAV